MRSSTKLFAKSPHSIPEFSPWGASLLSSIPPEILEPLRRKLRVAHRMLDVLVAKVMLSADPPTAPYSDFWRVFLLPYLPGGSGHAAAGFFFFNASPTARIQSPSTLTLLGSAPVGLGLLSDI